MSLLITSNRGGVAAGTASPSISISPTSSASSITTSGTTTVNFTLTRSGGFTGTVTPTAAGLPTGVTASYSPTTFGSGVTAMTMTLTGSSAPDVTNDAYTITFSGSGVSDVVYNGTVTVGTVTFGFDPVASGLSLIGETGFGNFTGSGQVSNAEGFLTTDFGTAAFNATRADAPISPSGTFETRYPGNDAGNGSGGSRMWCNGQGSRRLYFRMWVFLPSNYSMHTGGEKYFYPVWNTGSSIIGWRPVAEGDANGTNWKFEYGPQSGGGIQVWEQDTGPYPLKNQWNLLEVYIRLNTGGANNGEISTWVNGSLVNSRTDVRWSDNATPALDLGGFRWDGTRGGGASSVLTPAGGQSRFYDHVLAYGSPTR